MAYIVGCKPCLVMINPTFVLIIIAEASLSFYITEHSSVAPIRDLIYKIAWQNYSCSCRPHRVALSIIAYKVE